MRRPVLLLALVAPAISASCKPDFGERASQVDRTRVLAMRSEPPEAHPGENVVYTLLVASQDGTVTSPNVAWSYCTTPVLLTENTSVAATCTSPGSARQDIAASSGGAGGQAEASVPSAACGVYGPEVPPGSGLRPHDPDATGGFYQPVRAAMGEDVAFGFTRLTCALTDASAEVTTEFHARYVANHNPHLLPLALDVAGSKLDASHVPRGARVHLVASWPGEGGADAALGAESYVVFDPKSQSVVAHRESMRVSWFVTDGAFDEDRTGRAEDDHATTAENIWIAPERTGRAHAWVVLRDSRGGIAFESLDLDVE